MCSFLYCRKQLEFVYDFSLWFLHFSTGFRSRPLPNVSNNNTENNASAGGSNRSSPARYEGKGVHVSMLSVVNMGAHVSMFML